MLGCLLEDLDALAAALAGEEPTGEDRALRALYTELRDAARRLRRELGGPVAPDDPGEPEPGRRLKRSVRGKGKERAGPDEPSPEPEPAAGDDWSARGLSPFWCGRLQRAGIGTVEAFRRLTREEFLALDGLGGGALARCEKASGIRLPAAGWVAKGCTPELSAKLARAGIRMPEDLKRYSPEDLRELGLSRREIDLCERLIRK